MEGKFVTWIGAADSSVTSSVIALIRRIGTFSLFQVVCQSRAGSPEEKSRTAFSAFFGRALWQKCGNKVALLPVPV
jgi:hypothetical protein